jgi:hypothetical protein
MQVVAMQVVAMQVVAMQVVAPQMFSTPHVMEQVHGFQL